MKAALTEICTQLVDVLEEDKRDLLPGRHHSHRVLRGAGHLLRAEQGWNQESYAQRQSEVGIARPRERERV